MKSKQAFERLMRENSSMLLTYIRSVVGSPDGVDDVFQETMVTAWLKLDSFDRRCAFGPWLRGIAKNHALNYFRKSQRDMLMCNESILDYLDKQFQGIESYEGDSWREKTQNLHLCIQGLPDIYKEVIRLRYLDEMKTAQVNATLDVPKETLKKRLHRAKKMLLSCLQAKGVLQTMVEPYE